MAGLPDPSWYAVAFSFLTTFFGAIVKGTGERWSTRKGKIFGIGGIAVAVIVLIAAVALHYSLQSNASLWPGWERILVFGGMTLGSIIWFWSFYRSVKPKVAVSERDGILVQYIRDLGDSARDMDKVFESAKSRMDILVATGSTLLQMHADKITTCVEEAARSKGRNKWMVRFILVNPDNPKILESLRATTGGVPDRLAEQARATRDKLTELEGSYPKAIKFYLIDDLAPTFSMWIVGDGSRVTANLKTFFQTDSNGAVFRANDPRFVEQCANEFDARWKLLEEKEKSKVKQ